MSASPAAMASAYGLQPAKPQRVHWVCGSSASICAEFTQAAAFMSLDAHAGARPMIRRQQENLLAAGTRRQHHARRCAEAHFTRLQIRNHDREPPDQARRIVGAADAGKY